ncbi:MAG: hypothetical protein ACTHKM_13120 [Tsuneonella sp.]
MRAAVLFAAAALAACSGGDDNKRETVGVGPGPLAEINAQPIKASSGEAALTPLSPDGGKSIGLAQGGCRYAYQGRTLLIAGGGKAVVVLDGSTVMLKADAANDTAFAGQDVTVAVNRAEGSPAQVSGGQQWPADLDLGGAHGAATFSPGTWTCSS